MYTKREGLEHIDTQLRLSSSDLWSNEKWPQKRRSKIQIVYSEPFDAGTGLNLSGVQSVAVIQSFNVGLNFLLITQTRETAKETG